MSLIVDSGAYTAWRKGVRISLDDYIAFCKQYPEVAYYVNLDVVPGTLSSRRLNSSVIEEAGKQSWENYQRMIREIPMEKVIPVFHQVDSFRWLERYLDHGVKYLGLSPDDRTRVSTHLEWLRRVRKIIPPEVMLHGFGVSSIRLLNLGWTSVDTTMWMRCAVSGNIVVPKRVNGEWDFSRAPLLVNVAVRPRFRPKYCSKFWLGGLFSVFDYSVPCSLVLRRRRPRRSSYFSFSERRRKVVDAWLNENDMPLGEFEELRVTEEYKRDRRSGGQREYLVFPSRVIRRKTTGVSTNVYCRAIINAKYLLRLAEVVPVGKIYFAGMCRRLPIQFEPILPNRLFSFAELVNDRTMKSFIQRIAQMREGKESSNTGVRSEEK